MNVKGLKKIAGETKKLKGFYSGEYLQLNYNKKTGEAWTDYFCSLGQNSWKEYNDSDIINCGNISEKKTMKEIAEIIHEAILKDLYHRLEMAKATAKAAREIEDFGTALEQDAIADDIRLSIREEKAKEDHTRKDFFAGIHKAL